MNGREIDFIRTALLGKNPIVEASHSRTAQRNAGVGVVDKVVSIRQTISSLSGALIIPGRSSLSSGIFGFR